MVSSTDPRPRPDVLLVVMDCVRVQDFSVGAPPLSEMPFCARLAEESIVFPRAVAPAGWTIPSHASIFTGQYPWVHGLHARGSSHLEAAQANVATEMAHSGYRTVSLSANPFVADRVGLTEGFESAAWGGWWERHLRAGPSNFPPDGRGLATRREAGPAAVRSGPLWPAALRFGREILRFPWLLEAGAGVFRSLQKGESTCGGCVATWIEPTLRRWLGNVPTTEPVFAFVNLMEAHEPYPSRLVPGDRRARREVRRVRQDFTHWLEGDYEPSTRDASALDRLYRVAVRALDHRIRAIVEAFREAGRWDRTALILTSDHGQCTGRNGWLSHGMSVEDELLRVPLWLRRPDDPRAGRSTASWASLVDIRPTILELTGAVASGPSSGVPLTRLVDQGRSGPVWSMSDGVIWESARQRMSPARRARFDRLRFARYDESGKREFDDPAVFLMAWETSGADRSPAGGPAEGRGRAPELAEGERFGLGRSPTAINDSIARRIESWGYV